MTPEDKLDGAQSQGRADRERLEMIAQRQPELADYIHNELIPCLLEAYGRGLGA